MPEYEDTVAFYVGLDTKLKETGTSFGLGYAFIGGGSVRQAQIDSDSGGINSHNVIFKIKQEISTNATIGAKLYLQEEIEGDAEGSSNQSFLENPNFPFFVI